MTRRTKIVATVGPASHSSAVLRELILAGVNVFRLNLSHGETADHIETAGTIRSLATELDIPVGILADLQGPKIRISGFTDDFVLLESGQEFSLVPSLGKNSGNDRLVGLDYPTLYESVTTGDCLLLDDGRIRLEVLSSSPEEVSCSVTVGGRLKSRKGINKLGGGIAAPALTEKDRADIASLTELKPDFVAVSFVADHQDVELARLLLADVELNCSVIAKIERAELVENTEEVDRVIESADGIMVARGDLGVEVGDPGLIGIQKYLIRRARQLNRVVITATQMMESMITNPMPTRAEVFDVANAVLDGTDAVMLSGETAVGEYPAEVVKAMSETSIGAEKHPTARTSGYRVDRQFHGADESIAMAAIYAANHYSAVKGILCLTESGRTPLLMSRLSSGLPIFALSQRQDTLGKLCLCRGVIPIFFERSKYTSDQLLSEALDLLWSRGYCKGEDAILFTRGDTLGSPGNTNTLKIINIGDYLKQTAQ